MSTIFIEGSFFLLPKAVEKCKPECSICLLEIKADEEVWDCPNNKHVRSEEVFNIGHLVHKTCINKWWDSKWLDSKSDFNCPMCHKCVGFKIDDSEDSYNSEDEAFAQRLQNYMRQSAAEFASN